MENKTTINIKNLFIVAGAYASYTIGAGFASGNEVLQFFGSWGPSGAIAAVVGGLLMNAYFCLSAYRAGQSNTFEKPHDIYVYYCGKYGGWVLDVFILLFVLGIFATMFSGAGSMINQFTGAPQVVGSVLIGVISAVVVFGGLKVVENVLGYAGIVIIVYIVILGIVSIFNTESSMDQAADVAGAVASGQVWQANMFELFPLSLLPGATTLNNPFLAGLCYSGVCLIVILPFIVSLGKNTKSSGEAVFSGIFSSIFFNAGCGLVIVILLMNFEALIDPATNVMYPIPTLAAVTHLFPSIAWTFMVIIIAGIFTTITGYLWLLTDRVFPGEPTRNSRILTAVLMVAGVALGSVLPFSQVVNFLWPLSGFAGILLTIAMIVKDIRVGMSKNKAA
jgi:uncharacterized membrane protein YkvI